MKKFWQLLKLQLLLQFAQLRPRNLRESLRQGKKGRTALRGLGILALVAWVAGVMGWVEWHLLSALISLQQPTLLLGMTAFLGMVITLVYGVFYMMSTLYFAKDTPLLAALPVSERVIFSARAGRVWVGEAGVNALFVLPPVILYMVRLGFDAGLLVRALVVTVVSPVIPLGIAAVICSLLAGFSAFRRHREAVTTAGSIVLTIGMMIVSMTMSSMGTRMENDVTFLIQFLSGRLDIVDRLSGYFPPAGWAAKGLLGDWGQLALLVAVSAAVAALVVLVFGRGYLRAASTEGDGVSAGKRVKLKDVRYRRTSGQWALVRREMLEVLRTPPYLLNCVVSSVILPLFMVVAMGFGMSQGMGTDINTAVNELLGELQGVDFTLVGVVLAGLMSYMAGMNATASTSVSREGKRHGLYRMIPVSAAKILRAKSLSGFLFAMTGVLLACAALLIMLPSLALQIGEALLWSALLAYFYSDVGVIIDAAHPKMNWASETQAVKNNFNMVIAMLIGFAVLALLGFGSWWMFANGHGGTVYVAALTGFLALLCVLGEVALRRIGLKKYQAIEG